MPPLRYLSLIMLKPINFITTIILMLSLTATAYAQWGENHPAIKLNLADLKRLDSLLLVQFELGNRKEMRIGALRAAISRTDNPAAMLTLASQLFEEYRFYDSDSALHYADLICTMAKQIEPANDSLIISSLMDQAFMFSIQGYNDEASKILSDIIPSQLSNTNLIKYYRTREYADAMRLTYGIADKRKGEQIKHDIMECRDALCAICKESGRFPHDLVWIPVASQLDKNTAHIDPRDLNNLHLAVDTVTDIAKVDQTNAYWLAQYYKQIGNDELMIHYFITGAQGAIASQRREMTTLPELAQYLYEFGDINRANDYIIYSYKQLKAYKNRNRMLHLSQVLGNVRDAYQEQLERRDTRLHRYVAVLFILLSVLLAGAVYIIMRNKVLSRTREELLQSNQDLNSALEQRDSAITTLERAIRELSESDNVNRGVIAFTFRLTSHFINEMDNFRKKLLRKFRLKQLEDVGVILSDSDIVKEQYAVFYAGFDKTILSIFPDFIDDYNEASAPDVKVDKEAIEKSGTLNMRLRIYALRRLGIEKSADIAQMLNVSIRTVYNNRSTDPKPHVSA